MSADESGSASGSTPLLPEEYDSLRERLRETVNATIPRNATVLVVSRGDDELLRIGPRRALHFPQDEFGRYPGYHPEDSEAVIEMLESMRVRGGEYLLLPSTAFWWLDYYDGFRDHLERRYPAAVTGDECMIFELTPTSVETAVPDADTTEVSAVTTSPQLAGPLDEFLGALLPDDARIASEVESAVGADFLVLPAGGEPAAPPAGWSLVTRQRHLCEVYERQFAVGSSQLAGTVDSANREPRTANRGFLQRLFNVFRR